MHSGVIFGALFLCTGVVTGQQDFSAQITEALQYFSGQAEQALPKVVELQKAIADGDLDAAKHAYDHARDEYEQIEVLAPGFGDLDCAIDCRAYAYTHGEGYPNTAEVADDEFQGFHRIEALLYRNGGVSEAKKYADGLVELYKGVRATLNDPSAFNRCDWYAGVKGLAYEVGAKKMSSEEETYSDLSIMIFHNNFIGIEEALKPLMSDFASVNMNQPVELAVAAAKASVQPHVKDGGHYTPYSEVGTTDRAAIQKAAYVLAIAIDDAGTAFAEQTSLECPEEAEEEEGDCVGNTSSELKAALTQGIDYFLAIFDASKPYIQNLVDSITNGDELSVVRTQYDLSRPIYEQIEVLAAAFSQADSDLDSRPYGYSTGEKDPMFQGFHRVERFLYRDDKASPDSKDPHTSRALKDWAMQLMDIYNTLRDSLAAVPEFQNPATMFDSVLGVLTEVPAKKISSEEEMWSDLSIMIFRNNWLGARSQLQAFADMASSSGAALDAAFEKALKCVESAYEPADNCSMVVAEDVTPECVENLVSATYTPYREVPMSTRECIVREGYVVIEAAKEVAKELDLFDKTCHAFHHETAYSYRHSSGEERVRRLRDTARAARTQG